MKRTQEEIRQFCDEINTNVKKVIQKEDKMRMIQKMSKYLVKHQPRIMPSVGLAMAIHALRVKEVIDNRPDIKRRIVECLNEQERL